VPLSLREGRAFVPGTMENKAERLEREVTELKAALDRVQGGSRSSAENPMALKTVGASRASDLQGFVWGPDHGSGAGDSATQRDPPVLTLVKGVTSLMVDGALMVVQRHRHLE